MNSMENMHSDVRAKRVEVNLHFMGCLAKTNLEFSYTWKSNLSLYTEGTGVESWLSPSFIVTVLLSHSLFIKGAGLFSAACPENGLHGGRDLCPTFVFSPTLSVVILALALNGRGFIPAWGGGPLELVVSTPCWAAVGGLWMLTWIINNGGNDTSH